MTRLPIEPVLPDLAAAIARHGSAVLHAPPGAGKTTRVPQFLLETDAVSGRIVMLEPRRVAARAAAERLAALLGEPPGRQVGYRMRGETVPGARIEVVTDGVLTRMIQTDPELSGVGCVIFDEFHERGLQADLGLALTLELRDALRPDLKLLVMSATLDTGPVSALLGDAPIVVAEGRSFPVETRWLDQPVSKANARRKGAFETAVADLVEMAISETEGGVLVFLPGQGEIRRVSALLSKRLSSDVAVQELYGRLRLEAQRAALKPLREKRKLVLATSIAETSLTIPDIRVVIDGGQARRARFDPGSGMSRLVTEKVTRAEADQRRGRAGRVYEGWCYRLWTKGEEGALGAFPPPEIASADLAGLVLELAVWGAREPENLGFLTPPPKPAFEEAQGLLRRLGALDRAGLVTEEGRALARLPVHPRLGHMLRTAAKTGGLDIACDLAALLENRDPLNTGSADLLSRLNALRASRPEDTADPRLLAAIRDEAKRLRQLVTSRPAADPPSPGGLLSFAYPDRIAKRRAGEQARFLLSGGKGAVAKAGEPLGSAPFLVAADLDGDPREARIRRALPVTEAEIRALHAHALSRVRICEWSRRERSVIARERLMLGAIALDDRRWMDAPDEAVGEAMLDGIRDLGLDALPWTPQSRRLAGRVEWLRAKELDDLPDFSDAGLMADLDRWLLPSLAGIRRADQLSQVDLLAALETRLGWQARQVLDRLAPERITAPTGIRLPVDYADYPPSVSVRVQELFGLKEHPVIGPDRIPVLLHLLSPAQRPIQTTADLPGFWRSSYADVRKDLRGRYPKHPWPEDPASAEPTRRTKPRTS
ncbi:MAG: ATP-dependent helicase HrpB [Pseudomonadota bacterium]